MPLNAKMKQKQINNCLSCHIRGIEKEADFVHLNWHHEKRGFCWEHYESATEELLTMYKEILVAAHDLETFLNAK